MELVPSKFPVVTKEIPLQEESESGSSDPDETHWDISKDAEIFSPEDLAQEVEKKTTDREWEHLDWAERTEETLNGDFYRKRVRVVTERAAREVGEETGWLLIEKTTDEDEDDSTMSVKAWICWDLDDSSLEELVQWTTAGASIERFHRDIKQHLGSDEFQDRSWDGFHRHLAVVMLAHAFIAAHRLETEQNLPSFEAVIQRIACEAAIQQRQENLNCDRQTAIDAAEEILQGFTDWQIPKL